MWQVISLVITIHLLSCISPGPDFALVVKTALSYSRRSAILTAAGISCGILLHTSYCALGLGVILLKTPWLFKAIRFLGGLYLVYLGARSLLSKQHWSTTDNVHYIKDMPAKQALQQGFIVNVTNPKAILFILGLFIIIAKQNSIGLSIFFIIEMTIVTFGWFVFLAYFMTHVKIKAKLLIAQTWINRILGLLLLSFGTELLWGIFAAYL